MDIQLERSLVLRVARAALLRHIAVVQAHGGDEPRRLHVDPSEPSRLLEPLSVPGLTEIALRDSDLIVALDRLREHINETPDGRLARLEEALQLDDLDLLVVCVLVAPELEPEFERAYAFAWSDFPRKRIDVRFVAELAGGGDGARRDAVLLRLAAHAPLRRHSVVELAPGDETTAFGMRAIRLADRISSFVRGHDTVDETIATHVQLVEAAPRVDELVLPSELIATVRTALKFDAPTARRGRIRLAMHGQAGSGRALLVTALCMEAGHPVIRADLGALVGERGRRLALVLQEAALRGACCVLDRVTELEDAQVLAEVMSILRDASVPLVLVTDGRARWLSSLTRDLVEITVAPPGFRDRVELWKRSIPPGAFTISSDLETTAARYGFTGSVIRQAALDATRMAMLRNPLTPRITLEDLSDASRRAFSTKLGELAQRIPPAFTWSDLVVPPETADRLKELVRFVRLRPFLLEEWGFAAKLPYGRGASAILSGPPGTGKTMVAQLLARELGYDLYRIDLSQVVNKYIGETEKNLGRIFSEAESSHGILFFDEADALFAKRTEVKSSNDRYANLEVNYLLQRMETYDGVTLLATNIEQGIDPAFKRRVRFSIEFEMPDAPHRELLWKSMFPTKVPIAPDMDWRLVAEKFEMSGGYIKKAALRAALSIADAGRPLMTSDLIAAALHEYREMGRVL